MTTIDQADEFMENFYELVRKYPNPMDTPIEELKELRTQYEQIEEFPGLESQHRHIAHSLNTLIEHKERLN